MDINNDGIEDVFSGSFPGEIYLFKGLGNNKYAKPILLKDKNGDNICGKKSSSCFVFDYDEDGDYDLIISCGYGVGIGICKNTGDKNVPEFSKIELLNLKKYTSVQEQYNNSKAQLMPSHGVPCDWDNDGIWDLVCGDEHGNIVWYKNHGSKENPEFKEAEVLRDNINSKKLESKPRGNGCRSKLFIYDYNNDGKKDIILGDFYGAKKIIRQLTPKQERLKAKAEAEQGEWISIFMKYLKCKDFEIDKLTKKYPNKNHNYLEKEAEKNIPRKVANKYRKLKKRTNKNRMILTDLKNEVNCYHGYVWVYLRK